MEKISVIIPIYKVEKYLEKCVRSIMNQTYRNLEIICVNDGSPDGSQAILERLQKEDDRIIILNKENGGLGDARNYGLKYATSEWISFIDSDDYVAEDMYQKLSAAFDSGADMIYFTFKIVHEGAPEDTDIEQAAFLQPSGMLEARNVLYSNELRFSAVVKLYRKSIIDKYQIHFEKIYYEDMPFTLQYLSVIDKVYNIPERLYYYITRHGSIMSQSGVGTPKAIDHFYGLKAYYDFILKTVPSFVPENKELLLRLFSYCYECALQYTTEDKISDIVKLATEVCGSYDFLSSSYGIVDKNRMVTFVRKDVKRKKSSLFLEKIFSVKNELYAYKKCKVVTLFGFIIHVSYPSN